MMRGLSVVDRGQNRPTPHVEAFHSNVIDLECSPGCWAGNAFDYVHYHVPRATLDDIAADLGHSPVATYRLSVVEEDLVLAQLTKSILPPSEATFRTVL